MSGDLQKQADLCVAVHSGNIEAAEVLIAKGVDLNKKNAEGHAAVHLAVQQDDLEMVELLLENGAVIDNEPDIYGATLIAMTKNVEIIRVLINAGAIDFNYLLSGQSLVLLALQALGYANAKAGHCLGVSMMALQAAFIEEPDGLLRFTKRLLLLGSIYYEAEKLLEEAVATQAYDMNEVVGLVRKMYSQLLQEKISAVREKIKDKHSLTPNEEILSELPGFLDGISMYQQANHYRYLFPDVAMVRQEVDLPQFFLMPEALLNNDDNKSLKVQRAYITTGIYDLRGLTDYFQELNTILQLQPGVTVLQINSSCHAILACYLPKYHGWYFIDPNLLPPKFFPAASIENFSRQVLMAFLKDKGDLEKTSRAMSMLFYSCGETSELKKKIQRWHQENLHSIKNNPVREYDGEGITWIWTAVSENSADDINFLLSKKVDLGCVTSAGFNLLHEAAAFSTADTVNKLLQVIDVNSQSGQCVTPLMLAAERGDEAVLQELLSVKNIDINYPDYQGKTALLYAVLNNNVKIVRTLKSHGAFVDITDSNENSPLLIAAQKGYLEVVKELIEHSKVNVNHMNNQQDSALLLATMYGHLDVVKTLVEHGANIDHENAVGLTPLIIAIINDYPESVLYLIGKGANVNYKNKSGYVPLDYAMQNDGEMNVKVLLQAGAIVNNEPTQMGLTIMDIAPSENIKRLLLKAGAIDFRAVCHDKNLFLVAMTALGYKTEEKEQFGLAVLAARAIASSDKNILYRFRKMQILLAKLYLESEKSYQSTVATSFVNSLFVRSFINIKEEKIEKTFKDTLIGNLKNAEKHQQKKSTMSEQENLLLELRSTFNAAVKVEVHDDKDIQKLFAITKTTNLEQLLSHLVTASYARLTQAHHQQLKTWVRKQFGVMNDVLPKLKASNDRVIEDETKVIKSQTKR